MTSYVTPKKGVEFIFYAGLPSVASSSIFQSNPTIAAGDFKVSIDGGALANLATLPAVTPASSKMVKFTLSTSEMNGDNITVIGSDAAGSEWKDILVNIQTSARQIDDLAYPTVSGRSLDVSAGGEAGIDWANVGSPTTTVTLSGTTVKTATDVETDTADIQSRLPAALVSGRIDASVGAIAANAITAASMAADASAEIADAVWDEDATGHQTQGSFGQVIGDSGADTDSIWALANTNLDAAVSTRASQTSLDTVDDFLDTEIAAIKAKTDNLPSDPADASVIAGRFDTLDTNLATVDTVVDSILVDTAEIGAAGAGLTAVPWNASWDAEVQSEVDDALVAQRLDELLNADSDIDGLAPPTVGSVFHELMTKTTGSFTYDQTTDSLEALRDRGDAAWITATGFSTLSAADVSAAVWNAGTASYGTAGSYGLLIETNLDAAITTRASQTSLDTVDDFLDTEIAAIKAKTDNLPADPADASDIAASFTTVNSKLDAIDDYVDTEVAAIKAKTDQLTFTTANQLDAQVLSMAAGTVTAAAIATNAIDADAIAADAVTEIQAGLSTLTAAGVRTAVGLASANLDTQLDAIPTAAEINAEVVDALSVDTYSQPGQGTPAATTSMKNMLAYLYKAWRNKTTQTATTYSLYNDDASTVDQKATTSDNGTTFEKTEVESGP